MIEIDGIPNVLYRRRNDVDPTQMGAGDDCTLFSDQVPHFSTKGFLAVDVASLRAIGIEVFRSSESRFFAGKAKLLQLG